MRNTSDFSGMGGEQRCSVYFCQLMVELYTAGNLVSQASRVTLQWHYRCEILKRSESGHCRCIDSVASRYFLASFPDSPLAGDRLEVDALALPRNILGRDSLHTSV